MLERRDRIEGTLYREIDLRKDAIIDEENRTVRISISSETPYKREAFFSQPWIEILGHKKNEIVLDRFKKGGAPLLYNHERTRESRLGVVESATIKDKRIEAVVSFSKNSRVDDVWEDVRDGKLSNVSVGYRINERKLTRESAEGEPDEYRVTNWTPMEVSFVDIPADPTVGLGRDGGASAYRVVQLSETDEMKYDAVGNPIAENEGEQAIIDTGKATRKDGSPYIAPAPTAPNGNVVDLDAIKAAAHDEGVEAGVAMELERRNSIEALFTPFGETHAEVMKKALSEKVTVDAARDLLLKALGENVTPAGGDAIRVEEDATDKFIRAASISIAVRSGNASKEEIAEAPKTGFRGYTMVELARRALDNAGINSNRMDKMEMVGRAFTTSDFPLILADAANKSMLRGYLEAPESWQQWARTGNLSDFKTGNRVNLSSFNDLTLVNEDGEYTYGSFTENSETITLATYGKLFAISRQAIINDDLNAFTRIPAAMGRAASRLVGDLAYGALTANPNMGDGIALFHASHNNLNESGAGGTPMALDAATVAAIEAMEVAMALQSDVSGSATALNITPGYLIVPRGLFRTASQIMRDTTMPGSLQNSGQSNRIQGLAEVVGDARLDADSATAYYLVAGSAYDTVEVAFLDGNQAPVIEQQQGWSIDGTEFKVRLDAAAAPLDWRTMQKDAGT